MKEASAASAPMASDAEAGFTKPAAGVMATIPATAPEASPTPDILPCFQTSMSPHAAAAAAGAKKVLAKAVGGDAVGAQGGRRR